MAWNTELVTKLRYIINDIGSVQSWTDTQLQNFIGIAAEIVGQELNRWGVPIMDFDPSGPTLTPDPTDSAYDAWVGSMVVLKAAAILTRAESKKLVAGAGFIIVDDKSRIDTSANVQYSINSAKQFEEDYQNAIKAFKKGNVFIGVGILAPYMPSTEIASGPHRTEW